MATISFNEWSPDAADLGNPGAVVMTNCVPGATSYKQMNSLVVSSDALDDRPRGAIESKDKADNVYQYAGDETHLYSLVGLVWTDHSQVGDYATGATDRWEFVRWRETVIATNYIDDPQTISFGGTNFADLTTDLRMKHIAVVNSFVVAGYTEDGTDGIVPDRVRWSAINDATNWTVDPATLSDFRDLKGGGIQQIVGGEYGVILSEFSTYRMTFVGSPTVFQIDEVMPGVGALAPGTAAALNGVVYYPSNQGFIALAGGTSPTYIGAGKVDEFFREDFDEDYPHRLSVVSDPRSGTIFWAYPGAGNTAGRPNRIIVYDTKINKWSLLEQDVELLWKSGGVSTTLEALDSVSTSIDDLGVSLDSPQWKGSAPLLAAFDSSFESGNFSGAPLTAVMETKEVELHTGARTQLNAFTPLVSAGEPTARIRSRSRQSDDTMYGTVLSLSDSGKFTQRKNARYHSFELTISGGFKDAIGVQVDTRDAPKAQGRG